jgi:peptidoglycan/LPS O-acetylase OafA/YrhL
VAILAVIALHTGFAGTRGGEAGVDLFFVLSGFLITGLLCAAPLDGPRLRVFYLHRFFRLMPALLCMLLVVLAVAVLVRDPIGEWQLGPHLWLGLGLASTYTTDIGHMIGIVRPAPVLHTWSLALEEQFYLLWPFVLHLVRSPRRRLGIAAAAAVGSSAWSLLLAVGGADEKRVAYGLDTRLTGIALGCCLGLLAASGSSRLRSPRWLGPAGLVGFALLCATPRGGAVGHSVSASVSAVVSLLLVLGVITAPSSRLVSLLELPLVRAVGLRAYSLYLWNIPVFHFLVSARMGFGGGALLLIKLVVNAALAELSYRLVERPVRAWGYAWTGRRAGLPSPSRPRGHAPAALNQVAQARSIRSGPMTEQGAGDD